MPGTPEDIWNEFSASLRQFILSRVQDKTAADDILQDVFAKIVRSIAQLKDTARLRGWLYRITRNTIIDHYRKRPSEVPLPETLKDFVDEGGDQDEVPPGLAACVQTLIQRLPAKYREAIQLTEFEGVTQKAMSERLGLSPSGAKSRTQRARAMIRDSLLECCCFELDRQGNVLEYRAHSQDAPECCEQPSEGASKGSCA
jgi:RNA polymerase sigma-70 factor (ECF subfamily)